jgi:hypothetical protein
MLSVYAECHNAECHFAECHFAECHNAECHYAECPLCYLFLILSVIMLIVLYAEHHYAECRYAECHSAKNPRSLKHSKISTVISNNFWQGKVCYFTFLSSSLHRFNRIRHKTI